MSAGRKRRDVVPRSETSIDLRVVDRIEARVGAIDRMEEGKQVEAAEDAGERTVEQVPQISKRSARDAIDMRSTAPDSSSARGKGIIQGRMEA